MDGSESWIPLKDMKESHPVGTVEFAKARDIDNKVDFAYWIPYTLRTDRCNDLSSEGKSPENYT